MMCSFLLSMTVFAANLLPVNGTQFFVVPGQEAAFTFVGDAQTSDVFEWRTTDGTLLWECHAEKNEAKLTVRASLPRGYYELVHVQTDKCFGVVAIAEHRGEKDPFFCMDGAISWLVRKNEPLRSDYLQIAARTGIFMLRDRLRWGQIEPQADALDLETEARYDTFRKNCAQHGVKVLELCHDAPNWMEKTKEKYPRDLVQLQKTWRQIVLRWANTWGGMEVWNEPEISFGAELPADQYMAIFKTFAYLWQEQGVKTPLVGPVMAHFHAAWLDNAAANGLLRLCDVFSFHTYAMAPGMQGVFTNFEDYLKRQNTPGKAVWITECGRPWKIGPGRPPREQDFTSAADIVMKGVLAKACGFEGYFPFVYPYYEERENNFGMMSRDGTPLRSMAAYAVMIEELSGASYVGDLNLRNDEKRQYLLFENPAHPEEITVVVSMPDAGKENVVSLPFPIREARRLTGETLRVEGTSVRCSDSVLYLRVAKANIEKLRNTNTWITEILQTRKGETLPQQPAVPVVLQYRYQPDEVVPSPYGYRVNVDRGNDFTIEIAVTNLSEQEIHTNVSVLADDTDTRCVGPKEITIPPQSVITFPVSVNLGTVLVTEKKYSRITISAVDSLALDFTAPASLEQIKKTAKEVVPLEIRDTKNWRPSIAPCGKLEFSQTGDAWGIRVVFDEGDAWVYPQWTFPENLDLSSYRGFLIRARCWDPTNQTQVRMFCYQPDGAFFTSDSILQTNGEWQTVILPFSDFSLCTAAGGNPNARLDWKQVTRMSLGGNTKNKTFFLEADALYLYK